MRDCVDDAKLHKPVRQQPERPLGMAGGRRAAGDGDKPRLLLAVKFPGAMVAVGSPSGEGCLNRVLDAVALDAVDVASVDVEDLGYALVGAAARLELAAVNRKKD